jgi:phosphohistidine swiveling domain-containing protein
VGIENATKVLKDGDLVEVDANHAQVNILKRK